jgi:exopolysaccharide biosynthesis polyprenyl glycosylphosphotransferase
MGELLNQPPFVAALSDLPDDSGVRGDSDAGDTTDGPQQLIAGSTSRSWQRSYARKLLLTDVLILVVATLAAALLRFGSDDAETATVGGVSFSYFAIGATIAGMWCLGLTISRSRDVRIVGYGTDEYARVTRATILVFGWVAIFSLLFKWDASRGFLSIAFPLGLAGLLVGRRAWRSWLVRERVRGRAHSRVLVVGGVRSAKRIAEGFLAGESGGYRVTGVWVPDRVGSQDERLGVPSASIPVMGTQRTLFGALKIAGADTVIVTDTEHLGHDGLKDLAWQLEGASIDLMVSPNVFDVAGPRIHVRGVSNMPFIHLERPTYAGAAKFAKSAFDRVFAFGFLLLTLPVLVAISIAVKVDSRGPVFYRSERIGVGGQPFSMLKFRSMAADADRHVARLAPDNDGSGPLFKMKTDPRVTRVGEFLRRYSLDELPQFINVLKGEMSVVGPRPPLQHEVEQYEDETRRRLLVKQGVTGLWQVSGRSDLTWEEAVRLDLDYVENWSMMRDLHIIWRTLRAVVRGEGAY